MDKEKLNEAVFEAKRFLKRVDELKRKSNKEDKHYFWQPKETGAIRRASMDLTRSLASLRKHG